MTTSPNVYRTRQLVKVAASAKSPIRTPSTESIEVYAVRQRLYNPVYTIGQSDYNIHRPDKIKTGYQ